MSSLFQDTFSRANVASGLGTATDGSTYVYMGTSSLWSVASNEGTLSNSSNTAEHALKSGGSVSDLDMRVRWRVSAADGTMFAGLVCRSDGTSSNFVYVRINVGSGANSVVRLNYTKAGTANNTTLTSTETFAAATFYWLRVQIVGTTVKTKYWADGSSEPTSWNFSNTLASITTGPGTMGLYGSISGAGKTISYDSLYVNDFTNLTGTAAGTATTSGGLSYQDFLSGTAAARATTSGGLTLKHPLLGTAACGSTLSGGLTLKKPLLGTAAGSASTSGGLTLKHPLLGTAAGSGAASGGLLVTKPLSGSAAAHATAAGGLLLTKPLFGNAAARANSAGSLYVLKPLSGSAHAISITAGGLRVVKPLSGIAAAVAILSGSMTVIDPAHGAIVALSADPVALAVLLDSAISVVALSDALLVE